MENDFFTYLKWRGDISFEESPLNSVDAMIFCQLSYLNFKGICPGKFDSFKTLNQLSQDFVNDNYEQRRDLGLLINPKTVELLFECAKSRRFGAVKLSGYVDKYSLGQEEQFSAVSFLFTDKVYGESVFVSFRGTDDTIIGWKEDFNLAFKENVPAQLDALSYLTECAVSFKDCSLLCGGHSKGGNLSLYSGAMLDKEYQNQLKEVYNFDGPGFLKETLNKPAFKSVLKKTKSYFPEGSIVGMLFEHDKNFSVVNSDGVLVMQHDPMTWGCASREFELCSELEKYSRFFNKTFNQWFVKLDEEKRRTFVETLFGALESTDAITNSELAEDWVKNGGKILKAFAGMDKELRTSAVETANEFVKLAGKNLISYEKHRVLNKIQK